MLPGRSWALIHKLWCGVNDNDRIGRASSDDPNTCSGAKYTSANSSNEMHKTLRRNFGAPRSCYIFRTCPAVGCTIPTNLDKPSQLHSRQCHPSNSIPRSIYVQEGYIIS